MLHWDVWVGVSHRGGLPRYTPPTHTHLPEPS